MMHLEQGQTIKNLAGEIGVSSSAVSRWDILKPKANCSREESNEKEIVKPVCHSDNGVVISNFVILHNGIC